MSASASALFIAVFLACAVEAVEAVTIVLAAGTARDWRSAGTGTVSALAVLAIIVAILGPAVAAIPITALRVVVGALLLVFGLQWLRKAVLRATGYKAKHDEDAIFAKQVKELAVDGHRTAVGMDEAGHQIQQSRFPTTRRAHDGDELAIAHGEIHILDDRQSPLVRGEALAQIAHFDLSGHSAT